MESVKGRYIRRFVRSFFSTLSIGMTIVLISGAAIGAGMIKNIIDQAPPISLESIRPSGFATRIYDNQGNLTETLVMSGANREEAAYDEFPEDLVNAFVAMEDRRFWEHDGIDLRSIGRAVAGVLTGNYAGGGSTITQQLIKNNVLNGGRENSWGERLERKIQEQYLAYTLEQNSGMEKEEIKRQILTNYLNSINLGSNTLGVKTAARRYFGKELSGLSLAECSVLAAITSNPSRYNPISNPENNNVRRQIVLQYMADLGYISEEQRISAMDMAVYDEIIQVDVLAHESSPYSYFTDELIEQVIQALTQRLGYAEGEAYTLLYSGGLEIHTTQDPEIQAMVDEELSRPENYAETWYGMEYRLSVRHPDASISHYSQEDLENWHRAQAGESGFNGLYGSLEDVNADVEAYKAQLLQEGDVIEDEQLDPVLEPQASFVLMDQRTGEVKALGGGRGEKTASLTLNRAAAVTRQPGSAFKVIAAFAPTLDTGRGTLGSVFYDEPYGVDGHMFRNWWGNRGYLGYSNIRDGITYSMNIVAVRTMMEAITPEIGIDYARNMGITTLTPQDVTASAALGGLTEGVTNLELTSAYASIANQGTYVSPRFFTKIINRQGNVLLDARQEEWSVMKDSTAFLLTDAMADSIENRRMFAREGISIGATSTRAALEQMPAAGKSGTTTNSRDVWFIGFTDYYTAGVWGGYDENNQSLEDTNFHKDIWKRIMDRVHEKLPVRGFAVPGSVTEMAICRKSGKRAISGLCDHDPRGNAVYTEYFAAGTEPGGLCDVHVSASVCVETGHLAGEFCPVAEPQVFLVTPAGSDSVTDDSLFVMPTPCDIHIEAVPESEPATVPVPEGIPPLPGNPEGVRLGAEI